MRVRLLAGGVFVLALAAAVPVALGQDMSQPFPYAAPEEVGLSSEKLTQIGDAVASWIVQGDVIGAELLIVKNDKAVFHEVYGWADREERRPLERNSIWSIKSMSKPFLAAAILILAEEGRLSLDDRLVQYLPEFAGDARTTIRHLLTHTSGWDGLGDTEDFATIGDWVREWGSRRPAGPFGEHSYSDFNYAALGHVVEQVSGKPADAFLEERLIAPLGLDDTYTSFSPDAPWAGRVSSRYRLNAAESDYEKYWTNREGQGWRFYPAAWGLWSTAMDYAKFVTMWLDGGRYGNVRVLGEEIVNEALASKVPTGEGWFYGYGWYVNTRPNFFGHSGFDGTTASSYPDDDALVVFLTHSRGRGHQEALENRLGMLEMFDHFGPSAYNLVGDPQNVKEVTLTPEERARYVGVYRGGEPFDFVARVRDDGERLHLSLGKLAVRTVREFHLVPIGEDEFVLGQYRGDQIEAIDPSGTVTFEMNERGGSSIQVAVDGQTKRSARRVDPDTVDADEARVLAQRWKESNRIGIDQLVAQIIDTQGAEAARTRYRALHASAPESIRFDESLLNGLGYRLMREGRLSDAIAVFEMNVEAYPEAPNPRDSLGEAYLKAGRLEEGVRSYERAVKLAEQQAHPDREAFRHRMERARKRLNGQDQ